MVTRNPAILSKISQIQNRFSRLCMPSTNRAIQPILLEVANTGYMDISIVLIGRFHRK
jgi:hypothetical protein